MLGLFAKDLFQNYIRLYFYQTYDYELGQVQRDAATSRFNFSRHLLHH